MLLYIVLLLELNFFTEAIGTFVNAKLIVPKLGLVKRLLFNGTAAIICLFLMASQAKVMTLLVLLVLLLLVLALLVLTLSIHMGNFAWAMFFNNVLGAGYRFLINVAYFSKGNETEKSEVSASFRVTENFGKVVGKLSSHRSKCRGSWARKACCATTSSSTRLRAFGTATTRT